MPRFGDNPTWYERTYPIVYWLAYRCMRGQSIGGADADDAANETFRKASGEREYTDEAHFRRWCRITVKNVINDFYRLEARNKRTLEAQDKRTAREKELKRVPEERIPPISEDQVNCAIRRVRPEDWVIFHAKVLELTQMDTAEVVHDLYASELDRAIRNKLGQRDIELQPKQRPVTIASSWPCGGIETLAELLGASLAEDSTAECILQIVVSPHPSLVFSKLARARQDDAGKPIAMVILVDAKSRNVLWSSTDVPGIERSSAQDTAEAKRQRIHKRQKDILGDLGDGFDDWHMAPQRDDG